MDKLKMQTKDYTEENAKKLMELFPNIVTESIDINGNVVRAIDKDKLEQEINATVVAGSQQRYEFTWPDKKQSQIIASAPINKTLRPCREESVNFDNTENLYIEGDNLEVLKLLQETYLGKIKTIYIDPPYNTGNDILYSNNYFETVDEFNEKYELDEYGNRKYVNTDSNARFHTDWVNMMYQRIRIAKSILAEDGFFLVAIDHNELFNLGQICDEIFGYTNRIGIISVVHKPEGRNQAKFIGPSNEFMLVYAKNSSVAKLQEVVLDEEQQKTFSCQDSAGAYRLKNFIRLADGKYATRESKPNFWYAIYVSSDLQMLSINPFDGATAVYPITETGVERTWKTTKDSFLERYKNGDIVAVAEEGKIKIYEKLRENQVIKTHWINKKYHGYHFGTKVLDELLGAKTFDFPKSIYLMHDIVKLFLGKNDTVLDFFSGSATTAHAVMQLNAEDGGKRKFIMVQLPEKCDEKSEAFKAGYKNICEIGKERIRRAGKKVVDDAGEKAKGVDIGFRVFKVDSSNMKDGFYLTPDKLQQESLDIFEENVKEDRSGEDLLFQGMLELGFLPSNKVITLDIRGKKVFSVSSNEGDEGYLIACFEENLTEDIITEIAKLNPCYFVTRNKSIASDSTLSNFEQIFKTYDALYDKDRTIKMIGMR